MAARKRGSLDTFGKRMRQLRVDLDMRQEDLLLAMVQRCGVRVGQSYISELERSDEDRRPSGDVAVAVATVLGTTTDYLFRLTDDPDPLQDNEKAGVTEEAELAADMIDTVTDKNRRQNLLDIVRLLVQQTHEQMDAAGSDSSHTEAKGRFSRLINEGEKAGLAERRVRQ